MLEAIDFWLDMGVDGFRLDAVPYLYEREGTNCENLPETHAFLQGAARARRCAKYTDRMLLAEANQWPEDAIAYFGAGDECHMAFHFPLMPRLFMAMRMEDRFPVMEILQQTPAIPDNCQWALFLRNHDELTLEMVTDEERDYMYRVYAQDRQMRINLGIRRRLAPLLENDRRNIELMNALLFSLPGTPVIYYGDEIGMGDNIYLGDRNGVRTPMQWTRRPQRRLLARQSAAALSARHHRSGVSLRSDQRRDAAEQSALAAVVDEARAGAAQAIARAGPRLHRVSASRKPQRAGVCPQLRGGERAGGGESVALRAGGGDRSLAFPGHGPAGALRQGRISRRSATARTFISLGPHAFYWFALQPQEAAQEALRADAGEPPLIAIESWDDLFSKPVRDTLGRMMPAFLRARRWFRGKIALIRQVEIFDLIGCPHPAHSCSCCAWNTAKANRSSTRCRWPSHATTADHREWVLARLQARDGTAGRSLQRAAKPRVRR